jgi:hypothetical protein
MKESRPRLKQQIKFSLNASKELKSLLPIFKKLRSVHQAYIDGEDGEDCPYWFSERPQVGLLAAAVWRSGGTALEEYGAHKRRAKDVEITRGRCDLWIRTREAGFECEAKQLWLNMGNLRTKTPELVEKVFEHKKDGLKSAISDVKRLKRSKGLALCFVLPVIQTQKFHRLEPYLHKWVKLVKRESYWDAFIWIQQNPPLGRKTKHPGLLLIIKEVK